MKITTSRFQELQVESKDIILFQEGLFGFEDLTKFFIVDPNDKTLILWLQSVENPSIAFPVLEPKIFQPHYKIQLLPLELNSLQVKNLQQTKVYVILTIPKDVTKMTANLKAPLIINNSKNIARQIVLQDNKLHLQYSMYTELKKYLSIQIFKETSLNKEKNSHVLSTDFVSS